MSKNVKTKKRVREQARNPFMFVLNSLYYSAAGASNLP